MPVSVEIKRKVKFEAVDADGQKKEFAVLRPSSKQQDQGQKVHNRAFREAVESGAILRAKVEGIMRQQGLWDDAKKAEYEKLQARLLENEKKLQAGGIKLSQGRELAIQMRRDRVSLREMLSERNQLDQNTAEAQAENARFSYFVSVCLVYNTDEGMKPVFKDYEDYQSRASEAAVLEGASKLMLLLYNADGDFEKKLPENKFLVKYKLAKEDTLHLMDKQGRLVDTDGRLVDANGRYINEKGEFVDLNGQRVDENGDYVIEFSPFLDDDGKTILDPAAVEAAKESKTKKKVETPTAVSA